MNRLPRGEHSNGTRFTGGTTLFSIANVIHVA